ncbi:predicted protein [Aspergillus terreus NIH2624]|uniref:Uncharacterized protein n=1 Tax=Aspergillus terreus (strain NIH 2624 / FGSC A1156) TaxID=341663 RepID=Q0CJA7_ASPTN|nr:uncharacterized protein ATEG_06227 [Aspergillus terreus NIH2624]EAU33988.1 predicted protein [Aspergillus terreus NIH2624]
MKYLLFLCLGISQTYCLPTSDGSTATEPLFVKMQGPDGLDIFEPYQRDNLTQWKPDSTFYEGVPMVEKQTVINGETLIYQDFNISALTLEQFKKYIMSTPDFFDSHGSIIFSDEDAQAYREFMIAAENHGDTGVAMPLNLTKRDSLPATDCSDSNMFCRDKCLKLVQRGVVQSTNDDVYGDYHYDSDSFCGTGSITKTVSVTDVSGVTIGGTGQIPGFGKGWTKLVSTFFNTFGFNIGNTPDSVTTAIGYTGNCGSGNVCFLWHRPHFTVNKGVIINQTEYIDAFTQKTCQNPDTTPYEAHIMHEESDGGGAGKLLSPRSVTKLK